MDWIDQAIHDAVRELLRAQTHQNIPTDEEAVKDYILRTVEREVPGRLASLQTSITLG